VAGDRAPDVEGLSQPCVRHRLRLFDLLRGTHHTLLSYTNVAPADEDCRLFHKAATALAENLPSSFLRWYAIAHPDSGIPEIEGLPILVDTRNEFAKTYAARRNSVFLVRPDGYLVCRINELNQDLLQSYFAKLLQAR
jgi:hypothetical protein